MLFILLLNFLLYQQVPVTLVARQLLAARVQDAQAAHFLLYLLRLLQFHLLFFLLVLPLPAPISINISIGIGIGIDIITGIEVSVRSCSLFLLRICPLIDHATLDQHGL